MQVATKYKRETTSFKFVNYSSNNLQSARNMSDVLKNKIINPWRKSRDSIEIIEENNMVEEFDGLEKYNSANLAGILAISVVFGSILNILDEEGKPIVQLVTCLFKVMMKMVDLFIWYFYFYCHSIILVCTYTKISVNFIYLCTTVTQFFMGICTQSLYS